VARRFWFETPAGNYRAGACVISCFDARFELVTRKFVKRRGVVLADHVRVAGGARALASQEGDGAFLIGQVQLSMRLHHTDRVILVAHSDCGAYGGLEAFGGDADREQAAHRADLARAAEALRAAVPGIAVECWFADFSGVWEVSEIKYVRAS
jgi:carbonic anhydrase